MGNFLINDKRNDTTKNDVTRGYIQVNIVVVDDDDFHHNEKESTPGVSCPSFMLETDRRKSENFINNHISQRKRENSHAA